ncbi:hypothetical protein BGLA2_260085 [Burkholderia gladioli]|nr:hypothetical protein BGLA2_260085 [Burkholderia gladioli]
MTARGGLGQRHQAVVGQKQSIDTAMGIADNTLIVTRQDHI